MIRKRSGRIIATIAALFSFLMLAYISCKKPQGYVRCEGVTCLNGGYCAVDTTPQQKPHCVCPIGWEGSNCATAVVNKYFGTWDLHQHITGSDSMVTIDSVYLKRDTTYPVFLQQTATPTTFFINNFFNNPYYNYIICTLDSLNSHRFYIDTISDFHQMYDHYKITWNDGNWRAWDSGLIAQNDTLITGNFIIRFKNKTTNWQIDTVQFKMTQHHIQ